MTSFEEFLQSRLANGGFTTEDALTSFLPLLRQVVEAHGDGKVAPLEGLAALHVEGVRIWFEESRLLTPKFNRSRLVKLERLDSSPVEIVEEARVEFNIDEGVEQIANLRIGERDEEIKRPVFLRGYVSWEHLIEHHDPVTDIFSLGLILAGLACGLNLSDDEDFEAFVAHRRNLFALNPKLHPVLARAITRMTELDRHRRPQDSTSLLRALENYSEQEVDFDLELARVPEFSRKDLHGKQQMVLSKLQERLFEISRRNRLLQFRETMQTVNLTHASVPLSFDVRSIRPDRILVWNDALQKQVASEKKISLNKYLNFQEAVYLPSVLDRIRLEAQRDKNEYGFAQLRLVACFLRWANLKESPPVEYDSPLVLVPVELTKKKGVRDTFFIKALDQIAEVNPVLRHLFKQLYDIDLPETIDLEESALGELHEYLVREIESSEPAVSLTKIERPRIDLIHDKARRRLDQYRRRARLAGRGVRRFLDLDYSYDPANYHPLGLMLFNDRIRSRQSRLESIIDATPTTRHYAMPPTENPVVEKKQTLYQLRERGDGNPFAWEFDLCSVTLGNFKYRKMSLVRDYDTLLEENLLNPAFDATFSLTPRSVDSEETEVLPLAERFHVVPCDTTQTAAIAESRSGNSYIIQGPPGTGKSQTITNLIADYVARGKRVLFVCEKRAAIDVVYHRLQQKGLDRLSCLIHDSQADKKEFVMDLKRTYEAFLDESSASNGTTESKREKIVHAIERELAPLAKVHTTMTSTPPTAGVSVYQLLCLLIELKNNIPKHSAKQAELIPPFADCAANSDELKQFAEGLRAIQGDGILAQHPLRLLNGNVRDAERPIAYVSDCLKPVDVALRHLLDTVKQAALPRECWDGIFKSLQLYRYAVEFEFLAKRKLTALLVDGSEAASGFDEQRDRLDKLNAKLCKKEEDAKGWKQKLSASDVCLALQQAHRFENDWLRFLKPTWWRLRSVLKRCYNFRSHQIRPRFVQVLEWLEVEHVATAAVREAEVKLAKLYQVKGSFTEFAERVVRFPKFLESQPEHVRVAHRHLLASAEPDVLIASLARNSTDAERLPELLDRFLVDYENVAPDELLQLLIDIDDSLDELPDFLECTDELSKMPSAVVTTLRANPWTVTELEAAAAHRSFGDVLRAERTFAQFNGRTLARQVKKLDGLTREWQDANSQVICDRVRARFLEHVKISTLPAAQLTSEQKPFKKEYARGRRKLEHEFGKTMRYKPIRDLVAAESGMVVKDLKPIWLMSPLSVSDTLPLNTDHFDVVIFDEASQILLEEAIPSLFRATQTIVVGDEMQLPPTNFFSARRPEEDEQLQFEEDGELVEYDLESNSFLNHTARNLPSRMLGWHYRSRSESLISFSNWAFYGGQLLTVPEEELVPPGRPELTANSAADAADNAKELLKRAVSFHFMEHGVYKKRRNRTEAEYIAELVCGLLKDASRPTIGIVAFSEAQQDEIEAALERLAEDDREFRARLEAEIEREEDNQFAGLLVKNLENIQGDERDVIVMSVCYAPGPDGRMRMNFGPINQSGGEKRLNVAFSRAKHHMALVSSIRFSAITNDYNDGANCLKNYLHYAESSSIGDAATTQRILQSMTLTRVTEAGRQSLPNAVVDQLEDALCQRGFTVDRSIGQSQFRCDLAIRRDGDTVYRLGILVDTADYYRQIDLLERDLMKPNLLRAFGWRVAVVLAKDWWENADAVLARLERIAEEDKDDWDEPLLAEDGSADLLEINQDDSENKTASGEILLVEEEDQEAEREATESSGSSQAASLNRYLEFISGSSYKFWEITVEGPTQIVNFGRIGSSGQTRSKLFDDTTAAEKDALRQIHKKLEKGYEEKSRE